MKQLIFGLIAFTLLACNQQNSDQRTEEVKQATVEELMSKYENCKTNASSTNECKHFIAQSICEYNAISDLRDENGNYVDYHSIFEMISQDEKWKNIGSASNQQVLSDAQTLANEGLPVIAINTSDKHKFSVLIIKGETQQSRSWNLKTPNSAAFFPVSGPKSYINKPLSYSWSKPEGILLFVRK